MEQLAEGVSRSPQWLSLGGKVMLFQVPAGRRSTIVTFCSFSFTRENNSFLKVADGVAAFGKKGSCPVFVLICKSVPNIWRRVRAPYVLVANRMGKGGNIQYSLLTLSSSNQLETCLEFKLPYEMGDDVVILKGPTVMWTHEGDVFYSTVHVGEVKQFSTRLSHIIFGELPMHKGQIFVLGLPDMSNTQVQGLIVEDGHVFDGGLIIPHAYMSITRCLLVLSAQNVDGGLKCTVVAATSMRQLVYFENGTVKNVCQLPFEEPRLIQVVHTGRNGSLFAITFAHNKVCAVGKATFEVTSQWSGVSTVLVDDFLRCGTDQMLLVFMNSNVKEQRLDHFLITDLCGISYSNTVHEQTVDCPPEIALFSLNALEGRQESGVMELQDLMGERRSSARVLLQSVEALSEVGSTRQTDFNPLGQENLLPLWDHDQDVSGDSSRVLDEEMHDKPAVPPKPQIDGLWHRVIEEQLVVGVMLTTDSSIQLSSLSLFIMTEPGQTLTPAVIETKSQVFIVPNSSSGPSPSALGEPPVKRNRLGNAGQADDPNGCRLAVTAVTRLTPLLNSASVKCPVMLHYVQRQRDQAPSSHSSDTTSAVLHCGQVAFDFGSVFQTQILSNPKLRTDEVREDLLSLLAVLDHWAFIIDSPDHSLGDVEGWIKKTVGCETVEVNPQYLLFNSSTPSAVMLLHWQRITSFNAQLSVHSSQVRMLQFLDSLLFYLPASCSVQPVRLPRQEGSAQTSAFSLALEKELMCLKDGLESLLDTEGQNERTGLGQGQRPESSAPMLPGPEARQGSVKDNNQVDVAEYRKLTQSLTKIQLYVDTAVSSLLLR